MITLSMVLSLGLQAVLSTLFRFGFVLSVAHFPLLVGNLHIVLDLALIGLALSVFRGEHLPVGIGAVWMRKKQRQYEWRIRHSVVPKGSSNRKRPIRHTTALYHRDVPDGCCLWPFTIARTPIAAFLSLSLSRMFMEKSSAKNVML